MTDRFQELLNSLGKVFALDLQIDKFNACSIQIHPELIIQLQLDASQENLFLFSKLIEIPPGKFRENVLRETLKANGLSDPRPGIFGYIGTTNHLALFQQYPLSILDGERLANFIGIFLQMADLWIDAIKQGQASPK